MMDPNRMINIEVYDWELKKKRIISVPYVQMHPKAKSVRNIKHSKIDMTIKKQDDENKISIHNKIRKNIYKTK